MVIKDKVIIVTGASMGIGHAVAIAVHKKGAKVVLAARSEDKINELAKELEGSVAIVTDMTKEESINNLIDETIKKFGRIDVLVNNAGQGIYGFVENVNVKEYEKIIQLNVLGPLLAMQKVIPLMRKQGGVIVNTSSMVSKNYFPMLGAYASTKYALNALSLTARTELEKDNIIVSVVHPTLTDTDFGKNSIKSDEMSKMLQSRNREGMPKADSAEYIAGRFVLAIETGKAEVYAHDEMDPEFK